MSGDEHQGFGASITRRLDAAHVVVLQDDGGLEVFHGLDLGIEEGREEAVSDCDDGPRSSELRYYCNVRPCRTSEPDVWIGSGAAITIIGIEPSGATVTMTGRGMYDRIGDGAFQIEFDSPPRLTTWSPFRSRGVE